VSKHGRFIPDCTDLYSIRPFLDLSNIMDYDEWEDNEV
jgi:hypothetical protein